MLTFDETIEAIHKATEMVHDSDDPAVKVKYHAIQTLADTLYAENFENKEFKREFAVFIAILMYKLAAQPWPNHDREKGEGDGPKGTSASVV